MHQSVKKIGLILLVVFLLPALFFSAYEINSLNENEEIISKIYVKQLDAILYSLNQYANDEVSTWAEEINLNASSDNFSESTAQFLQEHLSIQYLILVDSLPVGSINVLKRNNQAPLKDIEQKIAQQWLAENTKLKRLLTYLRGNYRKIESLTQDSLSNSLTLVFALDSNKQGFRYCGLEIDASVFISTVLSPQMQSIAEEELIISALNTQSETVVYATDTVSISNIQLQTPLWILPQFAIGITPIGSTIASLAKDRSYLNLSMILVLDVILLLAVWWVFQNIRREINLAQTKSDFVSNVSHEIRTPLAVISMYAETLQMGRIPSEERRQQYYDIIQQESQRLAGIVNKILNFSQIEAKKKRYLKSATQLNEVLSQVLRTYEYHLKNEGFEVNISLAESLPEIMADQEALLEAVVNLLDNAIKYSDQKKVIHLSTGQEEKWQYLEVKDQGMGIAVEHQKAIFDKFYRISTGDVHNTKGTGLGLTLVQHIMHAHQGYIDLKSKPGQGSTFRLYFPLEAKDASKKK